RPQWLHVEVFAHDELVLIVAPDHHWSKSHTLQPEALRDQELVLREQGSGIREVIEEALLQYDVHIHPLFTLTDNEAIKQMVMSGVGAAIVSALTERRVLEKGYIAHIIIAGLELSSSS